MTAATFERAYLGGTFDCWHHGHEALCWRAAQVADEVVLSLNTDEFAERYKRRPRDPLPYRIQRAYQCRYVTLVVVNSGGEDSSIAIDVVRPDVLIHGDDWTGPEYLAQLGVTQEWLDARGIAVVYLPYTQGVSTTDLLKEMECQTTPSA